MCLVKTHIFPRISWETIKVYKYLEPIRENFVRVGFVTPFMHKKVQIGDTIKARKWWFRGIFSKEIKGEGVHAFTRNFGGGGTLPVVEAEIPPFTPYWLGEDNDIAASRMKLVKVL